MLLIQKWANSRATLSTQYGPSAEAKQIHKTQNSIMLFYLSNRLTYTIYKKGNLI